MFFLTLDYKRATWIQAFKKSLLSHRFDLRELENFLALLVIFLTFPNRLASNFATIGAIILEWSDQNENPRKTPKIPPASDMNRIKVYLGISSWIAMSKLGTCVMIMKDEVSNPVSSKISEAASLLWLTCIDITLVESYNIVWQGWSHPVTF